MWVASAPSCRARSKRRDVRLTTRYDETGLHSLWSTLHEAGHGLYAHGISKTLERTPLAGAPSLGLNESQSRTWENLVGRSRPFWTHWFEPLQATFPDQLGHVGLDDFVAAINRAEPGLIRVDADEELASRRHETGPGDAPCLRGEGSENLNHQQDKNQ